MEAQRFNEIVETTIKKSQDVLCQKQKEYATEDRLHNFKVAASLQKCSQKQACAGFLAKHIVSIFDMSRSDENFSDAQWDEKIGDSINYLLLLRAIIEEDKSNFTKVSVE